LQNIENGDSVAVAVNKGFKSASYESNLSDITVGNTINASGLGLGDQLTLNMNLAPDYFLFTQFANGVSLSDTLHNGEAQSAVKSVLNDYFKFKGNTKELGKKLGNINIYPNTDIPKELSELVRLARSGTTTAKARQFQQQINKAYKSISKLDKRDVTETRSLKKAYTNLIEVIEANDVSKIDKVLDHAFYKKVDYVNSRIARTEMARSYEMSFQRQMQEDKSVIGFQWLLSSAHPRIDICDAYSDSNMYGMGDGVYPKDAGANIPAHPNCLCTKVPIYETKDGNTKKGQYSQKRVDEYLGGLSERDRKNIIGAKDSKYKKDYSKGLKKQGFAITAKPKMISKSILTKAE